MKYTENDLLANKDIKDFKIEVIIKKDFELELDDSFEYLDVLTISKKHIDKYCKFGKCANIALSNRGECPHGEDGDFFMIKSLFDKGICEYEEKGEYVVINALIRSEMKVINNLNKLLSNTTLDFSIKEIDYNSILASLEKFKKGKYIMKLKNKKDNSETDLIINDLIISYKYLNDEKCFELENESIILYMPNIYKVEESITKKNIATAGKLALIEKTPILKIYDQNYIFIIYDHDKSETQIEGYSPIKSRYGHLCGEDCIGEDCAYWAGGCLG